MSALFRKCCNQCGAPVRWLEVREAERDPEIAPTLAQARSYIGPVESVWQCTSQSCRELGFFSGWAVGF
jgi:hypothetical protein